MEQTMESREPKYRLNIKQNAKKEMYFDITYRSDSMEDLTVEIEKLKRLAMIQCGQIITDAPQHETKNYAGVGIE